MSMRPLEELGTLQALQRAAIDRRAREERLKGKPSAQVIDFGNRVEKVSQEPPEPVPQPLPEESAADEREQRLTAIEDELHRLRNLVKREITEEAEIAPRDPSPPVPVIIRAVSAYYRVAVCDLKSARRTASVVRPRQVAMYLAKTLTLRSLPDIGRRFGGRDHTTVLHGVRKIEALRKVDDTLAADIERITETLTSGSKHV